MAKNKIPDDKPNFLLRLVMRAAAVLFVIFCLVSIISTQSAIMKRRAEADALQVKIDNLKLENQDLQDIIDSDDIGKYIERKAIENPNNSYAYPDERRYFDTSRD